MKDLLITLLLSLIAFNWVLDNKGKNAVLIIVFMLAIFGSPFQNRLIHTGLNVDLSALIIVSVWIAMKLKYKDASISWTQLSKRINWLYYFLFMGVFLGLLYLNEAGPALEDFYQINLSPFQQVLNNSTNIILVILFLKILTNYQYDDIFRSRMAKVFAFTIFIQVFSQLLKIYGMEDFFGGLFRAKGAFDVDLVRNIGLWTGFGQGVYVVLLNSFSLLYYNKRKLYSLVTILLSIVFSILTGSRQTIVFLAIFYLVFAIIYIIKRQVKVQNIILLGLIVVGSLFVYTRYLTSAVIVERFSKTESSYNKGGILAVTNRNVVGIPFVYNEVITFPVLGKGSLDLYSTKNSNTNIAGHVVWFNIYKKFGAIGVIYLLIIILFPTIKIFKICLKSDNQATLKEGAILFSLMTVVFAQQFFDNFFWFSNTMLFYAFIYFFVLSFLNRQKFSS